MIHENILLLLSFLRATAVPAGTAECVFHRVFTVW